VQAIYLDHAATTNLRREVLDAMLPYFDTRFGNPSSIHRWGREARNALEEARERLARALGARRREVIFTGGGTEADNLAVLGCWRARGASGAVVCSAVEHKAVSAAAKHAGAEGAPLIVVAVDADGLIDIGALTEALRAAPCVVSVMWGNNEVGTIQPIAEIAAHCRNAGIAFHTDAVQAFGKLRVRVDETAIDMLSISAHKIGGPKGVGALFVRDGVSLHPLTHGGGQERDLRPGTENVAAAVGLAVAAELAANEQVAEHARLTALRDRLQARLCALVPDVVVNGAGAPRLPHILHVSLPAADQEALIIGMDLEGVAVSGGSACQSGTVEPSHVLVAMGRAHAEDASVRFSLGHSTTVNEVDAAAEIFARVAARVRLATPA
jgi:cysteine desulfurase